MLATKEKKFSIPKETDFDKDIHKQADEAMREEDRVLRWRKIHRLLRDQNKKARKEQDKISKECAEIRNEGIFKKDKSKIMGLRFGVSLPPLVYRAIVQADIIIDGHSELANPNKEDYTDLKATNQIVKDLQKAFPQYKVTR